MSCTLYSTFRISTRVLLLLLFLLKKKKNENKKQKRVFGAIIEMSDMKPKCNFAVYLGVGIQTRGSGLAIFCSVVLGLCREDPLAGMIWTTRYWETQEVTQSHVCSWTWTCLGDLRETCKCGLYVLTAGHSQVIQI